MIESIFRTYDVLPISVRREHGKSAVSFIFPPELKLSDIRKAVRYCEFIGQERGGEYEGYVLTVPNQEGRNTSQSVACISVWSRHEASLCTELIASLPRMLKSSLVPVIHL